MEPVIPAARRGRPASRLRGARWIAAATFVLVAGAAGAARVEPPVASQAAVPAPGAADSFPHARHTSVACLTCHATGSGHGRLTFEPPRGCAICHHQAPAPDKCGSCHRPADYGTPKQETVTITVPGQAPRPRTVAFLHEKHVSSSCVECHTTPVTLAPATEVVTCQACHTEHHAKAADCSSCHQLADPKVAHPLPDVTHQRCDACHTATTVAKLTPTRALCATCHAAKAKDHHDARECTVCHLLADPAAYRAKLLTPQPR
ncbi:MAG: hypothetical protein OEW77_00670 [Gemmatimonadota bacterium]|nr:hypothetical protein [Gemmatimonadota bacterium]